MIQSLHATEILDSRGRPTVKTTCVLDTGEAASASVPSGRSTGTAEALELRDGDPARYDGLGCRKAVANVNGPIAQALLGKQVDNQAILDQLLIDLDGTPNKSNLGANAILSVSLAFARATAAQRKVALFQHFAELADQPPPTYLPRLAVNLFSGGKHAGQQVAIQDVLIVPIRATTIDESLSQVYAVYYSAARLLETKYGQRLLRADEGGLSPPARSTPELLDDALQAIRNAGIEPGKDIALAIDVASTHFHHQGIYKIDQQALTSEQMIDLLVSWTKSYPIISYEDALAEDDWMKWPMLKRRLSSCGVVTLGDDFLCTNPTRITRAIGNQAADALLLKVNQIGTLTEAAQALHLARRAGWQITVSARSGETEDNWLADLSVGFGGDYIKIGSITQSERLAKYNRLLAIEADTHLPLTRMDERAPISVA